MSTLIVDFAHLRESFRNTSKSVKFSAMSEMRIYERPDKFDACSMYYSNKDYQDMKTANENAVQAVNRRYHLSKSPRHETSIDDSEVIKAQQEEDVDIICKINGLENNLSPKMSKKVFVNRRRRCIDVLAEQSRQDETGEYDPEQLASVSRRYSKWSVKRANQLASIQAFGQV